MYHQTALVAVLRRWDARYQLHGLHRVRRDLVGVDTTVEGEGSISAIINRPALSVSGWSSCTFVSFDRYLTSWKASRWAISYSALRITSRRRYAIS
jgi:hypothetical protein